MHNIYDKRQKIKFAFVAISLLLVFLFLFVSELLVDKLSTEERKKMEIWAEATRLAASPSANTDFALVLKIIRSNSSIPVIIVDEEENILHYANVGNEGVLDDAKLQEEYRRYKELENLIEIPIDKTTKQYLYYDDSVLLKQLALFPYIQLGVMLLFVLVAYIALMNSKRAEQNQVWVGLSKETAHQLGTPISSLMAWMEILKMKNTEDSLLDDMDKDVKRLSVIADRFSKIGSVPELQPESMPLVVKNAVEYMQRRVSGKVKFNVNITFEDVVVPLCVPLMEWVVENLCKNAIDSMNGVGELTITFAREGGICYLDVADTGKGIARKYFKTVFRPGYTTKKRGWGLGLALVKRIVEDYHKGRVFVKESELGKGATFRIELRSFSA